MLSVKQGGIKCHFLSLWYDSTWDWIPVSRTIGEHSTHEANELLLNHHHHHFVLVARISLTLSRHFSQSFIVSGRSSVQHPVSSHSCWMYVRAGRPAFARPCVGVHKSTSLMSSSLLLQQCPACLVRLTWIVFVIGGKWPYSWCLVGVLPPGLVQDCSQHSCYIISIFNYYMLICSVMVKVLDCDILVIELNCTQTNLNCTQKI